MRARYSSEKDKQQGYFFETKRLRMIKRKRDARIQDVFHKVSRYAVSYCVRHNIGTLMVGYNREWKQGHVNRQTFIPCPLLKLKEKIVYKGKLAGITVIEQEQSDTALCSFLDNETVGGQEADKGERVSHQLFTSTNGVIVNQDVNIAYNLLRETFPNAFPEGTARVQLRFSVNSANCCGVMGLGF